LWQVENCGEKVVTILLLDEMEISIPSKGYSSISSLASGNWSQAATVLGHKLYHGLNMCSIVANPTCDMGWVDEVKLSTQGSRLFHILGCYQLFEVQNS